MIGLSFIGPTDYKEASYYWSTGEFTFEYTTDLFPEILPKIFPLSRVVVFVTEEVAKHKNCYRLKEALGDLLRTELIPLGKSEEELWEIFSIVAAQVPPHTSIIVDVTHAFRSLPLIVFNVASYLRRIKNVSVERIIYGNFEASDKSFAPPRTPIFDLTSTLDLQDWLHGIDAFQRRGAAEELADSLSRTQGRLYQAGYSENAKLPRKLRHAARQLNSFSESLRLLRPLQTTQSAAEVCDILETVQDEASRWAKPFADVLHDLNAEIFPLQNRESTVLNIENLQAQVKLIQYYLNKDLVVQAVLLAREWVVSMLMFRTDRQKNWRDRAAREAVEKELGLIVKVAVQKEINEASVELPFWYQGDPQSNKIAIIWGKLSSLRNNIAHCAMNTDAASTDRIRNGIKELILSLEESIL